MFWFLAVASILGYVVQNTLMAHHVRKMDPLSAGMYRSLTLIVTMLPLLFFTNPDKIVGIIDFWWIILLAGLGGALAQWLGFLSMQILPMGIHTAMGTGLGTIFSFILGFLFFGETVTSIQVLFVVIILLGASLFALYKAKMPHLDASKWALGIFYRVMCSLIVSFAFIAVVKVSREHDPFVAGYVWEVLIGICSFILLLGRQVLNSQKIEKISKHTFFKIMLVCSPTLIGTGGFVMASLLGPVGIISAIGACGVVISALLSWAMYNEKLSRVHWLAIFIVVSGVVGLNFIV